MDSSTKPLAVAGGIAHVNPAIAVIILLALLVMAGVIMARRNR